MMTVARLTKRERRNLVKSDALDTLQMTALQWDFEPRHGLTAEEVSKVHSDLADQLYRWAVRITPINRTGEITRREETERAT